MFFRHLWSPKIKESLVQDEVAFSFLMRHDNVDNMNVWHLQTCIFADKAPFSAQVVIVPGAWWRLEIEGEMVLVSSRGLPVGPVVVPPSCFVTPGPSTFLIFISSYPDVFWRQRWQEVVSEVVSHWGEVSQLSWRSSWLTEASRRIPGFQDGEILITVAGMAEWRPPRLTCYNRNVDYSFT